MPVPNTPNFYAVTNPMFQRAMRNILSITQGNPAIVVTTNDGINFFDNDYQTGLIVRLIVPFGYGMVQANKFVGEITVLSPFAFSIPMDSTNFDPFSAPLLFPGYNGTPAQVIPIGENNDILTEATQNVLLP